MTTSLSQESFEKITDRLHPALAGFAMRYPGETGRRQPVHTVYGGAHLFKSDTAVRLGQLAVRSFETFGPDAEEDGHAVSAAQELAKGWAAGTLSPFIGIRIKTVSEELHARSIRTLD